MILATTEEQKKEEWITLELEMLVGMTFNWH